jgi:CDP-glucose 4,6-dehydratase
VEHLRSRRPSVSWTRELSAQPHEAGFLKLDSGKARARLGWRPRWRLATALDKTLEWHEAWRRGDDMRETTVAQTAVYLRTSTDASCGAV